MDTQRCALCSALTCARRLWVAQSAGAQPVPPKGPGGPSMGKLGDVKLGLRGWLQIAIFKVQTKQRHLRQMADAQGQDL